MNQVANEISVRQLDHQLDNTSLDWCKSVLDGVVSVPIEVTVELGSTLMSPVDLESIEVGHVIQLLSRISDELPVAVSGITKYKCFFGQSGSRRAVQITHVYPGGEVAHETRESETDQFPEIKTALDVPLEVHVEFGRTRTSLGEILQLKKGSILELSSEVEEPLIVFVNGKAFAAGNIVTFDGRFGIEVTEILSGIEKGRK
jgi:flagellar motor switch protein FliN